MRVVKSVLMLRTAGVIGLLGCSNTLQPPPEVPSPAPAVSLAASPAPPTEPAPAPAASGTAAPSKPAVPAPGSPLDRIMQAHFQDALLIRKAVIAGTPERAADPAKVFGEIEDLDKLPPGWQGFVARMRDAARRITNSTSSAQTAAAAADLGVACGMCHEAHGGPKASKDPPPEAGTSVESRMSRHAWANERLWEGLYVPSLDAWNAGVKALSSEPFPKDVLKAGVHARSAANEFTKLVARAPSRKTVEERAALYAEMLVTCGACHQAVNSRD